MNTIKFSHPYNKLDTIVGQVKEVVLIGVSKCKPEILPEEFLKDDTEYPTEHEEKKTYYLNKKIDHLILFFYFEKNHYIFTTIRRWLPRKEEYYRSKIGEKFEVEMIR